MTKMPPEMKFQMEFQQNGYSYDIFMRTGAEITLKNKKISRLPLLAMFTTIALTIFMIESAIPPIVPIPGIKLGLSNIITLVPIGRCLLAGCLHCSHDADSYRQYFRRSDDVLFLQSGRGTALSFGYDPDAPASGFKTFMVYQHHWCSLP